MAQCPQFLQQFTKSDPRYSPAPFWWWSGEKLEIGRLRWQMDQLSAMGIHNVVIINLSPNGTLFGCDPDDPPFLSEPWWDIFAQVCDYAQSIGMYIWFYDQIGFSGARYQAELAVQYPDSVAQQLHMNRAEGVGELIAECPLAGTPLAAYIVCDDSPGTVHYLPVNGRRVQFHATAPSRLCFVYTLRQGYDLFSASACQRLLDTVHRQFHRRLPRHLGTTIVGSFQDELPELPTWGGRFAETFAQRYGYQIERVIHRLFEPGDADARRTRVHYHAHRADLAEKAFFKPFFQWHQDHQLQCGFDQQSPAREARVLGSVTKYADYIQTHRWYAIPGSDHFGNGKLHASIAFMYDRPRVWIEGFHSTGWGGTIADTFDWLLPFLQSGVSFYNPHAVYYSTRKGWWEWAPPSTCWRQPYARHYHVFADMIARLTKLLSSGVQQASIGVLFPTTTVQSAAGLAGHFPGAQAADDALHLIIGSMRWHQAKPGCLDELSLDFHLLDESTIQSAAVVAGAFMHRQLPIRTLILPHVTMLHDATMDRLIAFSDSGGVIISFGADQIETLGGRTLRISELPHAIVADSTDSLIAALKNAPAFIRSPVPTHYRRAGDLHILFVPAVAGMATELKWPGWFEPMEHTTIVPERYRPAVDLKLPANARKVFRFDPIDGSSQPVPVEPTTDGVSVHLDFGGSPFAVLVWSDVSDTPTFAQEPYAAPTQSVVALSENWTCDYVPTLPEQYADTYDSIQPELRFPHTTDFQWSGEGRQSEVTRATFGIRAWRTDAQNMSPQPLTWSPKFGILQDKLHISTLGPKGHVPEEFVDLGKCIKGQKLTIHTGVVSDVDREVVLAFGANARKAVAISGQSIDCPGDEYFWTTSIHLKRGDNSLNLSVTAEREGSIRLFWCFLDLKDQKSLRRPERMAAPQTVAPGSSLSYEKQFEISDAIGEGELKVSIAAMATVYLDGNLLGRQGGFDPYRLQMRGQIYSTPALAAGHHDLRIVVFEPDRTAPLIVDFRAETYTMVSDASWNVASENAPPQSVRIHNKQDADGAAWLLYRRPHPLPQTAWLEPQAAASPVLPLTLLPPRAEPVFQSFEWIIPPGAVSMHLPLVEASARIWIDDIEAQINADGIVSFSTTGASPCKKAVLRVKSRQLAGGVFAGLVTYQFQAGTIRLGSWLTQGLGAYSGAIRMYQTFSIPSGAQNDIITLDLQRVRGTVEATLNNRAVGIRCLAPYQFDLTGHARAGINELELLVTNTLANHLSTWSPTRSWSPDQLECGILGPVSIHISPRRQRTD